MAVNFSEKHTYVIYVQVELKTFNTCVPLFFTFSNDAYITNEANEAYKFKGSELELRNFLKWVQQDERFANAQSQELIDPIRGAK